MSPWRVYFEGTFLVPLAAVVVFFGALFLVVFFCVFFFFFFGAAFLPRFFFLGPAAARAASSSIARSRSTSSIDSPFGRRSLRVLYRVSTTSQDGLTVTLPGRMAPIPMLSILPTLYLLSSPRWNTAGGLAKASILTCRSTSALSNF